MDNKKNVHALLADRKISKGQVKHFLTRNASNKIELDKLTRHIDKERIEKESQFQQSQKLLLRRYSGLRNSAEARPPGKLEERYSRNLDSRPRSFSFDPSKLARDEETRRGDTLRFATRQLKANSDRASRGFADKDGKLAGAKTERAEFNYEVETRTRAFSDLPPLVLPPLHTQEQRSRGKTNFHRDNLKYDAKPTVTNPRKGRM